MGSRRVDLGADDRLRLRAPPFDDLSGGIPPNTELALTPDGRQLLVSWRDKTGKTRAKLLTLSGSTVSARRDVPLPADTHTVAWGRTDHHVLVTTWGP